MTATADRHVSATVADWREGSPDEAGVYWIVWRHNSGGHSVRLVSVSPAVIYPGGRLLLKFANGAAFEYAANRERITHHAKVRCPPLPDGLLASLHDDFGEDP